MRDVCGGLSAQPREFNSETNPVHPLVHHPSSLVPSTLVNSLKSVSSRRLRQEAPAHIRRYLWGQNLCSPSYFAGSRSGAPLSIINEYIEQQKRPDQPPATRA